MRSKAWVAGLAIAACGASASLAADYDRAYRWHGHHHNFRASIGSCVRTRVADVGPSPAGAPGIRYTDGVIQAYDAGMLGHTETLPGDPIQLCLISFSRDCGEAELPGRTYATGNLRTGAAWTLPDIRSSCSAR